MGRSFGSAAMAPSLAVGFAASAGASEQPWLAARSAQLRAVPGAGVAAGQPRSVILINGDRLLAGTVPGGGTAHVLVAGTARGAGGALMTTTLGGRTYAIPADAVPYLGRGLSADLFDIASLRGEQAAGRLPVQVRYAGRVPALPRVTITSAAGGAITETLTNAYQISS